MSAEEQRRAVSARHDYPVLSDLTGPYRDSEKKRQAVAALDEIDGLRRSLRWAMNELAYIYNRITGAEYERQLEDAALALWAEMPSALVAFLKLESPALVEFLQHLHHSVEHEQAMVRRNVWAAS